jgi:hypothetical protein
LRAFSAIATQEAFRLKPWAVFQFSSSRIAYQQEALQYSLPFAIGLLPFQRKNITARQMSRTKAIERTAALLLPHVKTIAAMAPAITSHPMTGNILKTPRANPELLCIRVSPKCERKVR